MAPEATTKTKPTEQVRAEAKLAAVAAELASLDDRRAAAAIRRDGQIVAARAQRVSHQRIADLGSVHKSNVGQRERAFASAGLPVPEYDEKALVEAGATTKALDEARPSVVERRDALIRMIGSEFGVVQERLCEIAGTSAQTISTVLHPPGAKTKRGPRKGR